MSVSQGGHQPPCSTWNSPDSSVSSGSSRRRMRPNRAFSAAPLMGFRTPPSRLTSGSRLRTPRDLSARMRKFGGIMKNSALRLAKSSIAGLLVLLLAAPLAQASPLQEAQSQLQQQPAQPQPAQQQPAQQQIAAANADAQ